MAWIDSNWLIFFSGTLCGLMASYPLQAQVNSTPDGMKTISGKHLTLITDLPLDDELRALPMIFDLAIPQWQKYFGKDEQSLENAHATALIMGDRNLFSQAGYLTPEVPKFAHGYQLGDRLFVVEQPSAYYRRHLLLHEGTHWFMHRFLGGTGPPWYMEGMAELLGSHAWDGKNLTLAVIPRQSEDVPYWGRIKLIRDALQAGNAPSLDSIMNYGPTAHRDVEAYAWSWAAVLFMSRHPKLQDSFQRLHAESLSDESRINRQLKSSLGDDWNRIRLMWSGFVSDLDYGYDPELALPIVDRKQSALGTEPIQATLRADRGWQSVGIMIQSGQTITIRSKGEYIVGYDRVPWNSQPQGITLEYFRGQPLGRLLAAVVPIHKSDPGMTQAWQSHAVGTQFEWTAQQTGVLMLKINESAAKLSDNRGQLQIQIQSSK